MDEQPILVCMRTADLTAENRARGSRGGYYCDLCGHEVGCAPASQVLVEQHPDLPIYCLPCAEKKAAESGEDIEAVPVSVAEVVQHFRDEAR